MSRLRPAILALAILVAGLSFLAGAPAPKAGTKAAGWPQFRGPNRDNVSPDTKLLTAWPDGGPKLAWKSEGIGAGFSSVSVVGDKIYTMGDKNGAAHLFALDRATGEQRWATKVGKAGGNYTGTRGTPTVDGKLVYGIGQFGDLVCLDIEKGEEKWRTSFPKDFDGKYMRNWGYAESPLVDGDRLICTPGGTKATVVALDKLTGKEIWRCPAGDSAGYSSIVISNAAGVKQYVQLTSGGTIGVDAKDGKLLWRYKKTNSGVANIPTPIVLGDRILTAVGYGRGAGLLTLSKGGETGVTMKEDYFSPKLVNKHGGVTIVGDYAYGDTDDSGHPYCVEWKTGELKWKRDAEGKGRKSCAITYADGHLYCRYENGNVALVPATPDGYKEVGSFQLPKGRDPSWPHPVVIGGKLYLREQNTLYCYDVSAKSAE
jgi:outer membrane protein assembly factor BamB